MRDFHPKRNGNSIRLEFKVQGVKFGFYPIPGGRWDSKRDRELAEAVCTRIKNDIRAGFFDPTLERYKHKASQVPIQQKPTSYTTLEIWDKWIESLRLSPAKGDHYDCCRIQIEKAGKLRPDDTRWFESSDLANSTYNRRLKTLRKCFDWAVREKLATTNPWLQVALRKGEKKEIVPFTSEEIAAILLEFDNTYPHYRPFVEFMFGTGCRTGEAVALRWKDIDFRRSLITIRESVSRKRGGYEKVRKVTKTGNVRSLQMSDRVKSLLSSMKDSCTNYSPENSVFLSPKGYLIDHGNFRANYWKPTLEKLGLPYRKPYTTRHTLLSHALEGGLSILQVAQIAGHSDGRMILQHYGHVINAPKLPEI